MAPDPEMLERLVYVTPVLAVVVLTVLARRSCLSERAFRRAPARPTPLGLADLGVGLLMIMGLGVMVPGVMGTLGLTDLPEAGGQRTAVYALASQLIVQLPVVLYVLLRVRAGAGIGTGADGLAGFGLGTQRPGRDLRLAVMGLVVAIVLVQSVTAMLILVIHHLGGSTPVLGHDLLAVLVDTHSKGVAFVILTSALVLAPLLEEVIYRGLVQSAIRGHLGPAAHWPAIFGAALLFGGVHAGAAAWHALPGLMVLGVILGWLYERTGSLLAPVLVHFAFNLINVMLVMAINSVDGGMAS